MPTYLQGLTIGLAYVAPIGMQNLFVINSALTQPRRRALLTALIVIAFDISLALACFFGIGALVERFDWLQRLILIVGGCIVVWIGIGLLRDKPTLDQDVDVSIPLPKLAAKAFVVTWINPQALIDGTMLFGSFRAGNPGAVASQLMLGSASASCLWFLGITILISFFSGKRYILTGSRSVLSIPAVLQYYCLFFGRYSGRVIFGAYLKTAFLSSGNPGRSPCCKRFPRPSHRLWEPAYSDSRPAHN